MRGRAPEPEHTPSHRAPRHTVRGRCYTDPDQMGGLPCLRGLRIPVATVIDMVADGMSPADIIEQALHYAAESVREREIPIRAAS